jgi:hypothetical protein
MAKLRAHPHRPIFDREIMRGAIDVGATPATPIPLDTLTIVGSVQDNTNLAGAWDVCVIGDHAFVTCHFADNLTAVNISDPTNPIVVSSVTDATDINDPRGLCVLGTDMVVVCSYGSNRLTVVDVSDPAAMFVVGSITDAFLQDTWAVAMYGDYAVVCCYDDSRITIVDLSDPTTPSVVSFATGSEIDFPSGIAMYGDYAVWVNDTTNVGSRQLAVMDLSVPASPNIVGWTADSSTYKTGWDVTILGNYALSTHWSGIPTPYLVITDISNPAAPVFQTSITEDTTEQAPQHVAVYVYGPYIYALVYSLDFDSLSLTDVTDPTNPVFVTTVTGTFLNNANGIAIYQNFVVVVSPGVDRVTLVEMT